MKYRVEMTAEAEAEVHEAYLWIYRDSPANAAKWRRGLVHAIDSLERHPTRCGRAPEDPFFEEEIRQLLYGKRTSAYRILFTIRGERVVILHVRHSARRFLSPEEPSS